MSADENSGNSNDSFELGDSMVIDRSPEVTVTYNKQNGTFNNISNGYQEGEPYLEIAEQPQSRGFRFRYKCEGGSHGGLQGENSDRGHKSFPTVRVANYVGEARIMVSLVTDSNVPKPHAHLMVGKNCKNGICVVELTGRKDNMTACFPGLGITHVTKRMAVEILTERILESMKVNQLLQNSEYNAANADNVVTDEMKAHARKQAQDEARQMQLNVVRLCFQAYLKDKDGSFTHMLPSVISNPIYDSKSPGAAALKICRMDRHAGCCTGNDEVFLLCDKVQKDDISVRFYEEDEEGRIKWEAYGNFGPADVHRQYAIVFKTPAYYDVHIQKPVNVQVQLKRISDNEISDPKPFTYCPQQPDKDEVGKKRKKTIFSSFGSGGGFSSGGGPGGFGNFGNGFARGTFNGTGSTSPNGNVGGGGGEGQNGYTMGNSMNVFHAMPNRPLVSRGMELPTKVDMDCVDTVDGNSDSGSSSDSSSDSSGSDSSSGSESSGSDAEEDYVDGILIPGSGPIHPARGMEPQVSVTVKPISPKKDKDCSRKKLVKATQEKVTIKKIKKKKKGKDKDKNQKHDKKKPETVGVKVIHQKNIENNEELFSFQDVKLAWNIAERTMGALEEYAKTGDTTFLLLAQRHLVMVQDKSGDTVLHQAVIHGNTEALRHLLEAAGTLSNLAIINECNTLRQTPLHLAVLTSQPDMVHLLLRHNADLGALDRHGNSPFHIAAQYGEEKCLKMLLNTAKQQGQTAQSGLSVLNFNGLSCLHLAVCESHLGCVKALVAAQVDVNQPDGRSGRTALHYSVETENLAIAGHLLLEAGADVNAPTFDGNTALHIASGRHLLGMAALLITAGADPEAENIDLINDQEVTEVEDELQQNNTISDEGDRVGHTPAELAGGDEKMLKILRGEPYSSVNIPSQLFPEHTSCTSVDILQSIDSAIGSLRGDIHKLDAMCRAKLAKLLDPARERQDWLALSEHLGLGCLVNALRLVKSPTKALLDNFEAIEGTVSQLKVALQSIQREDALAILREAESFQQTSKTALKNSNFTSVSYNKSMKGTCDSTIESGLGSLTLQSGNLHEI